MPRALGRSDLRVSPVGLGCWQFSKGKGLVGGYWPELADGVILEIVRASLEGGVDWFDTAEAYGHGTSEIALASALRSLGRLPGSVAVATKWWPALRTAGSMRRVVEAQRARLAGYSIDLYQVHQPFGLSSVEKEMDAMARLAETGSIRHIGVSNFNRHRMRRAEARLRRHGLRLVSNQVRYNLLDRSIEFNGVLDAARDLGVSIIAYSPLAQGILSGKYHDDHASTVAGIRRYLRDFSRRRLNRTRPLVGLLRRVALARGCTPAQVALSWLLSRAGGDIVVIPGATSSAQAAENAAAARILLSEAEIASLDAESLRLRSQ